MSSFFILQRPQGSCICLLHGSWRPWNSGFSRWWCMFFHTKCLSYVSARKSKRRGRERERKLLGVYFFGALWKGNQNISSWIWHGILEKIISECWGEIHVYVWIIVWKEACILVENCNKFSNWYIYFRLTIKIECK